MNPEPKKAVNGSWIQNSHRGCSSNIASENLAFSEMEIILDRYKWGKQTNLLYVECQCKLIQEI